MISYIQAYPKSTAFLYSFLHVYVYDDVTVYIFYFVNPLT